jgi:ammonium transporter, Amt family
VVAFAFVFAASLATFALIRATVGMRVSETEEEAGLDIVEHGMYGYPAQFIHVDGHRDLHEGRLAPR